MSAQTSLWPGFASQARDLVSDTTGRIRYSPALLDPAECRLLFATLRTRAPWRADERPMYDRIVAVPRLVSPGGFDPALDALQARVEAQTGERFNSVGLNLYRDERDSVAWHNDTLSELIGEPTIALVSLGAVRRMQIRSKRTPRRTFELDLEAGSLLIMSGTSQMHWEHRVPKETRATGERISVAFRQRPAAR